MKSSEISFVFRQYIFKKLGPIMLYKHKSLDEIIENLRLLGEMIVPYNFPMVPPPVGEDDLAVFKEREIIIDGYEVIVNYQKSDYGNHLMENLQIHGTTSPFLPFNLICKLGKRFLGANHLSLVELFRQNRKLYIWSVCVDRNGKAIPSPYDNETESCEFEGFNYLYLQPNNINFF